MRERTGVGEAAERRLAAVANQWRPLPPDPVVRGDAGWAGIDWADDDPEPRPSSRRVALGPWSASALRGLALLVVTAVAVAGYWAWSGRPRAVAMVPIAVATAPPITGLAAAPVESRDPAGPVPSMPTALASPAPTTPVVVVHVTGLVAHPGLVELPLGSRVADAVDAAGGVTRRRAAETVNLARILVDGEQIVVGAAGSAPLTAGTAAAPAAAGPVDLNAASAEALEGLPGVGPVIAARIVAWRTANGPFRSVDELGEVSGIGDAILAQVRALLRV
jgi:competence protein ComEA